MDDVKLLVEERHDRIDTLTTWLPRVALAIVFLLVGTQKFAAHGMWVRIFDQIGLGQWLRYLTGVMQIGGAGLLLIPRAAGAGFLLTGCTMVGAVAFWIFTHHAFNALIPGVLLLAIGGFGGAEIVRLGRAMRRGPEPM
jgi:putative oxidoreductase